MKNKEATGDRFWIVFISIVLAAALAVTAAFLGLSASQKSETGIQTGEAASDAGGGAVVSGGTENGMKLKSEKISSAEYAENGVSATAEAAYEFTATVYPDNNASNTKAVWTMSWEDPSGAWSSGKAVTDYVTLTPDGTDATSSKHATVACLQPFGEPIVVTVTVEGRPDIEATSILDYAQKLTDFSVSFGDIECDFESGRTGVSVEVNPEGTAAGGALQVEQTADEVYTLADEFTVTYQLGCKAPAQNFGSYAFLSRYSEYMSHTQMGCLVFASSEDNINFDNSALTGYDVAEKGLYFGLQYFADNLGLHYVSFGRGIYTVSDVFENKTAADYAHAFRYLNSTDDLNESYDTPEMFDLTVTIKGTYTEVTKTTTFYMNAYTNLTEVTDVTLDPPQIIF